MSPAIAHIFHPFLSSMHSMPECSFSSCMIFLQLVILETVISMKNDREMLGSILKTTQTGQISIQKILNTSMRPGLRKALQSQLREYNSIESEAYALATQRGWELREIQPGKKMILEIRTGMKIRHGNPDSKIADMMIQDNTQGMIQLLKNLHQFQQQDSQVSALSQRLLDCETANIRQLQTFL